PRLLGRQTTVRDVFLKARPHAFCATLERLRDRVMKQRTGSRATRELGDAGAHRARAHNAYDAGSVANVAGRAGRLILPDELFLRHVIASARPASGGHERVDPGLGSSDDQFLDLRGPL